MTGRRLVAASESAPSEADPSHDCAGGAVSEASRTNALEIKVHRHDNGHWSVYMRLPDGSTESCRGVDDLMAVDGMIWKRLCDMELQT